MSKEQQLADKVFSLPSQQLEAVRGQPQKVIDLIELLSEGHWMWIGREKAKAIKRKITEYDTKPKIFAELGGFVGYLAILLSDILFTDPDSRYYSFELNQEFANIARRFIELAGLSSQVEVIVGPAAISLRKFCESQEHRGISKFDFVLIDHWKPQYVPDLRVLESFNLIGTNSVIVADNILVPGAPEYRAFIKMTPEQKRSYNYEHPNPAGADYTGRWNVVYKTEEVPVEGDILAVTRCVDYLCL